MSNQPFSECRALIVQPPQYKAGAYLAYLNAQCIRLHNLRRTVDNKLKVLCADPEVEKRIAKLKYVSHELFLLISSRASQGLKVDVGGETASMFELLDDKPATLSMADKVVLKRYYQKLASKYHPRTIEHDDEKAKRFTAINAAYKAGSLELLYLFLATEDWYALDESEVKRMISLTQKRIDEIKFSKPFKVVAASIAGSPARSKLDLLEAIEMKIRTIQHQIKTGFYGSSDNETFPS